MQSRRRNPLWRLRAAGWPRRWLVVAWALYAGAILFALRAPAATRFLLPILVLAFIAPFVAGPERPARAARGQAPAPRPIIDVTPRPPAGLPSPDGPPGDDAGDAGDAAPDPDPDDPVRER